MKTIIVPAIGGLADLMAILADSKKTKAHVKLLNDAQSELETAAGGAKALREAESNKHKVAQALSDANSAVVKAKVDAEIIVANAKKVEDEVVAHNDALQGSIKQFDTDVAAFRKAQKAAFNTDAARLEALDKLELKLGAQAQELNASDTDYHQREAILKEKEDRVQKAFAE
jgi:pyruvate carboxylase